MRRLALDVGLMALATALSRILGLVRDVSVANRFGASAAYDAFVIAFFVPHFLRRLLAEGALSTAFVPLYTGIDLASGRQSAERFANNVLSLLIVVFPVIAGLGIWLAPAYVPFLASGFGPEKMALAIRLTRIVFPFIAIIGFAAVLMGILNANRRFFVASLAPVWSNVGMIVGVLVLARWFPAEPILGLAIGVLLGGMGQLISQAIGLRGLSFRFRFSLRPMHPEVASLLRRMGPALIALAVTQMNLLVDNKLASYLADGGISALQYGMRLFQLPLGIFAVSIATALLPRFAEAEAQGDRPGFSNYLMDGTLASSLVVLPAMAGMLLIGQDIVRLLFQHGSFDLQDTLRTARVLSFYLAGLLPYALIYVYSRALYARGWTVKPVIASSIAVAANVGLDLLWIGPMQEAGLALATAVSGILHVLVLAWFLRADFSWTSERLRCVGKILAGVLCLAAVVWVSHRFVADRLWWSVVLPTASGMAVYAVYLWVSGLWRLLGARIPQRGATSESPGGSEPPE